jgi:hypothetical protein
MNVIKDGDTSKQAADDNIYVIDLKGDANQAD